MKWEVVIGVEVHAELSTKSKIFCGCSTAFGGEPNTRVCPVCSGMPGALPKLNRAAVEYALRLGLALDCEIAKNCKFDRKNYFYPDLPKAYQISQLYAPICTNGRLEIEIGNTTKTDNATTNNNAVGDDAHIVPNTNTTKTIHIKQIHMEEDAGKLIHNGGTMMDFNRCGVPLLEIVSEPDFRSGDEVIAYLEKLRETLLFLDICTCKMQEGAIRADINLSVREPGDPPGVRTEMKNLNSLKAIGRAIKYESARQIAILERGGRVVQETRRWDDERGESFGMRSKENAQDYRYFPEPDLLPLHIDDAWLAHIKAKLPELAHQKRSRYMRDYGISAFEASVLTGHKRLSELFESLAEQSGEPIESARLITGEIMRLLSNTNTLPEDLTLDAGKLAALVKLVSQGKINRGAYKETVEAVFTENADPQAYIAEKGLGMVSDDKTISEAVAAVLTENPTAAADYRSGKDKAFGFLMGQVMRKLKGTGNPEMVKKILAEML